MLLEGAVDAERAALAYALAMTGSEGVASGPRARAAVAVARDLLSRVAVSQNVSLEALMTQLRDDPNQSADFGRIHAQARNQIFSGYYSEIASYIKARRKANPTFAAFTTESDDIDAVNKKVAIVFGR